MKITKGRILLDRAGVDAAVQAGWDWAEVEGREHRTKVVGTQSDNYALLKELNGRVTLMHLPRIIDLHKEEQ